MASKSAWIRVYKDLQRTAKQFPQYNYREFARRRIRDYFESPNKTTDPVQLQHQYKEATESLVSLKRQVAVSGQYPYRPLVIEKPKPARI